MGRTAGEEVFRSPRKPNAQTESHLVSKYLPERQPERKSKYAPFYGWKEQWQNLVRASRLLTPANKNVLNGVAKNLDKNVWTATVGIKKLAKQCGTSRGAILRAIKAGEGLGLLRVTHGKGGRYDDCNAYVPLIPGSPIPPEAPKSLADLSSKGTQDESRRGLRVSPVGDSERVSKGTQGESDEGTQAESHSLSIDPCTTGHIGAVLRLFARQPCGAKSSGNGTPARWG